MSIALSNGVEMMLFCSLRNVVNNVLGFEEIVIWSPFDQVIDSMSIILMLSGLNSCIVTTYVHENRGIGILL